MREKKMGPTEMRAEIIRLHRENKMPTLDEVLAAVADARKIYTPKILSARKGRKQRDLNR